MQEATLIQKVWWIHCTTGWPLSVLTKVGQGRALYFKNGKLLMKDILNREIRPNMTVAYPVNKGGLDMSFGRVMEVTENTCKIRKEKTDGKSYTFTATNARLAIIKGWEG